MPKKKKPQHHHFEIYLGIALVVVIVLTTTPLRQQAMELEHQESTEENETEFDISDLEERQEQTIEILRNGDIDKLYSVVHPENGLRFSPYPYIDKKRDRSFTSTELENISGDNKVYTWGVQDGSGDAIKMTFTEYYQNYIYNHDFAEAPEIDKNDTIGSGNMVNNLQSVYPESEYIEYHFPGFEEEFDGMDWQSLRLIYEQDPEENWYLVGIVHAEWTT
jgi:hypothetical protein